MVMRCVEVNLGSWEGGIDALNRMLHLAMCIQDRKRGLGWEYGETRPSEEFRIVYYREFTDAAAFDAALGLLRRFLGGDAHAHEVDCKSTYDEVPLPDASS
jgi:hypothetical protein